MKFYCEAQTRTGSLCRNYVRYPWQRCYLHHDRAINVHSVRTNVFLTGSVITLCLSAVSAVRGATATEPPSVSDIIVLAALLVIGILLLILGASEKLKRRSYRVESEIRHALGVEAEYPEGEEDDDSVGTNESEAVEGQTAGQQGDEATTGTPRRTSRYGENIFVTFKETSSASVLTEFVQSQSDGNARLVIKYYAQGYLQASLTFVLSVVVALAGFVLACLAIISFLQNPGVTPVAVVTAVVSAVTEIIGFLFFRRADKARELMTSLIDKLREDRKAERDYISTLALIDAIKSVELQDATRVAVLCKFADTNVTLTEIEQLAARAGQSAPGSRVVHIHPPDAVGDRQ